MSMALETQTGLRKKRGGYKQWQSNSNSSIPRSTLHSRRVASKSKNIQRVKSKSHKASGTAAATVSNRNKNCGASRGPALTNIRLLDVESTISDTTFEDLISEETSRDTNLNSEVSVYSHLLGHSSSIASEHELSAPCSVDSHQLHPDCENAYSDESPSMHTVQESDAALHTQNDHWKVVDEDNNDNSSDQEVFDEEEPFIMRLDLDVDDGNDNGTDGVQDVENVDSSSDEEQTAAPDFTMSAKESIKLLLLLATKNRHNLSYSAAEDIMELSGVLHEGPNDLPTRHNMKSAIEKFSFSLTEHHVCPHCGKYVGVVEAAAFYCHCCHRRVNTQRNRKSGSMFLSLSLKDQLQALLEYSDDNDFINPHERTKINDHNYEDVFDGRKYKTVFSPGTLTFNFFVDGLQIATTSKQSAWPVLVSINELKLHLRRKHILTASVWLSKKKPIINEYLKPFVKECIELSIHGCTFKRNGVTKTIKVKPCMCISDSIARPLLRNSKQFNGKFGCGLCYHPGVKLRKGNGTTRSYSTKDRSYPMRTHEELMDHAATADRLRQPQKGIKGKSILSDLPDFDMVLCIDLDSFHAVVNVAKRFCNLWLEQTKTKPAYNILDKFDETDKRLLAITPTSDVSRAPRSLTERSDYRGHEWFYFVCIYSVPVLKNILPPKYLNHWSLLVHGLALIMQNSVAKSELAYADRYLCQFVSGIDDLYGAENVTFSIHLLTHLKASIVNFSQPWTHSAFMYESYNNEIKKSVKSSNGAALQISKGMQLKVALQKMEDEFIDSMTVHQRNYLDKMCTRGKRLAAPHLIVHSASLLGKPVITSLACEVQRAIARAGVQCDNFVSVPVYNRCMLGHEIYHTSSYSKVSKQKNCVVLLDTGDVFVIESFIVIANDCYVLGYYFQQSRKKLVDISLPHFYILQDLPENILRCIHPSRIVSKLISFVVNVSIHERIHIASVNVLKMEMLS